MKIKICQKNEKKINEVLSSHNGRARSHVFESYSEIENAANQAENTLEKIKIPKGKRQNAAFVQVSGEYLPNSYKYSAKRGRLHLKRGRLHWFLTDYLVEDYANTPRSMLQGKLILTNEQNLHAWKKFSYTHNLATQEEEETRTYWCALINKNGHIKESFFRDGKSQEEVLAGLKLFHWPKGTWTIEEHRNEQ